MGILSDLMERIFKPAGRPSASQGQAPSAGGAAPARGPSTTGSGSAAQESARPTGVGSAGVMGGANTDPLSQGTRGGVVDIDATLTSMAASRQEKLDWKHSIVDLMKLVGMDSSLSARKALAAELHYTGDTNDSATMNMWLHKEVLKRLAANGGKLPPELMAA